MALPPLSVCLLFKALTTKGRVTNRQCLSEQVITVQRFYCVKSKSFKPKRTSNHFFIWSSYLNVIWRKHLYLHLEIKKKCTNKIFSVIVWFLFFLTKWQKHLKAVHHFWHIRGFAIIWKNSYAIVTRTVLTALVMCLFLNITSNTTQQNPSRCICDHCRTQMDAAALWYRRNACSSMLKQCCWLLIISLGATFPES